MIEKLNKLKTQNSYFIKIDSKDFDDFSINKNLRVHKRNGVQSLF